MFYWCFMNISLNFLSVSLGDLAGMSLSLNELVVFSIIFFRWEGIFRAGLSKFTIGFCIPQYHLPSLKLTRPLKIDPWKRRFLLETIIFRGELLVSGRVILWMFHLNLIRRGISFIDENLILWMDPGQLLKKTRPLGYLWYCWWLKSG